MAVQEANASTSFKAVIGIPYKDAHSKAKRDPTLSRYSMYCPTPFLNWVPPPGNSSFSLFFFTQF
jgi:hypothetical protein